MSKIVDLLDQYNNFSTRDKQSLEIYFGGIDTDGLTLRNQSGSRGSGYIMSTGNVDITYESGIQMYHPATGEKSIWLDPDGDALFGWDTTDPAKTALAIFSNDQEYNSNDYGKGDLLIGDDSDAKANIWWDRSAGILYFRSGTTVGGSIGSGGLDFELGSIGGWNFNATTLYDDASGIVMDSANVLIRVGDDPYIEIDGSSNWIQSSNFVPDVSGFNITTAGIAEFQDVKLRGKLQASVFEYSTVNAMGGKFVVSVDATRVHSDFTTPGSTGTPIVGGVVLEYHEDGSDAVAVNDMCQIKVWDGTYYSICWFTITSANDATTDGKGRNYGATFESGSLATTFTRGSAVVNYGTATEGWISLTADGAVPSLKIGRTTAGPWAGGTVGISLEGDGDAFFGSDISAAGTTSLAIFSTAQTYNTEPVTAGDILFGDNTASKANMFWDNSTGILEFRSGQNSYVWIATSGELVAGGGNVWINADGVSIVEGDASSNAIDWYNTAKTIVIGSVWSEDVLTAHRTTISSRGDRVDDNAEILLGAWADSGDSASITLDAQGTTGNNLTLYSNAHAYWTFGSNKGLSVGGGLYVGSGSTTPSTLTDGHLRLEHGALFEDGSLRVEGATLPTGYTGDGVELSWLGSEARLLAYDRTGAHRLPLDFDASIFKFKEDGTTVLTVDAGDIYTTAWVSWGASATATGFSAITEKTFYYKKIGNTVHCNFRLSGTSNSTSKTLSLPYTAASGPWQWGWTHAKNNGTWGNGSPMQIPSGGSAITIYWYIPSGPWTASGSCEIRGQFTYEAVT